ncbi:MAG TPA: ESPR-type extended signal peptide-containing protein [Veillonellaceae bacterium]|nr:ESPR-type extended signal peptide-containing protein [Veillonellaceae bacterium]
MNRIYKVIFNRSLGLYQVVSEIARNHGKSSSPAGRGRKSLLVPFVLSALLGLGLTGSALAEDTVTTVANAAVTMKDGDQMQGTGAASVSSSSTKDETSGKTTTTITVAVPNDGKVENGNTGLVTGGTVYTAVNAETAARETADSSLVDKIGTLDNNGSYIQKDGSVSSNLSALDKQVKTNADAITKNASDISTEVTNRTEADTALSNRIGTLNAEVKTNADAINKEKTDREAAVTNVTNTVSTLSDSAVKYDTDKGKVTLAGEGGTTITNVKDGALSDSSTDAVTGKQLYNVSNRIGTLDANGNYIQKDASVSSNLSTLDTQVKTNAEAISKEKTDRADAISALKTELTSDSTNSSLASKANVNASNIGKNITTGATDDEKKQKDNAKLWGEALGIGAIENNDSMLISGGTLYGELRPSTDGTYSYISNENTTAVNLIHLDSALNALGVEMLVDSKGNSIQYTSTLYKYFKVDPETTTNENGTKTYAPDAEANGTNSVAIGPNAKTAKYTTTTTSGDTTTTTETAADHAVAIGDGATVNAAGDKGIALGNGAVTGEAEVTAAEGTTTTTTDAKGGESSAAIGDSAKANGNQSVALGANAQVLNPTGTTVSTGSTAIGSGAKVDGGNDSIALGTSATVNTVSNAMALGSGATINKTAKESIAIGKAAATGGVDKPITLTNGTTGTLAAAGGVDSIAIGNGAVSEGNEALALGKGAKVTNGATGGDSAAAIVKTGSAAIGDGATVANSATSMALGNGASITEGENTTVIGSGAKATQTKQAFVAGYQASADSNASGSIALGDNASTHSEHTTAIGYKAEAHNADSIAIGSQAVTSDTGGGIAIGSNTSVAQGGIAVGKAANAQNISSLAIGNGAAANVNQSISIGYNAGVGTAEDEKEKNGSLVAIGTSAGNNVKGMQNVAIGASAGSAVQSSNNIAIGTNAGYGIKNVTSTTDTNPQNGYNISIGSGANYTEGNTNQNIVSSIAIGHATHAVNRAVAIGEGASAKGDSGMALGNSAASDGAGSIAIGNTASAADGNIALGAGSIAKGSPSGNARWTSQIAPAYYISVGNTGGGSTDSPLLRRISNVADGSDDHDVATVAQLQKVADQLKDTITGTDSDNKDVKTYSTTYIDNEVTELKNDIAASKTKYFSVNPGSQTANSGGTAANGDGDADAMAIGPNAKASNVKALAIGNNVSASGELSIAIGTANNPSTDTTTAENPHPTSSEGISSVAVGTSAIAQSDNSIAIGTRATTYTSNTTGTPVTNVGVQSIAIGYGAETRAENAISFGTTAKANSTDSIAVGHNAQALNTSAIVIGNSTAYGSKSITIGQGNTNNGAGVMTTGNSNSVTNNQGSTDVVKDSGIYGSSNTISSVTTSNSGNAITDVSLVGNGNELNQKGEMNVLNDVSVLGNKNTIENGTAGAYAQTVKQIAVVGSGNTVKGNTQIDYNTWGTVQRDTILGYKNTVDATTQWTPVSNLQILGNDVKATLGNSVYLGTGSSATASKSATTEAITLAKEQGDAEAIDSDEYKKATTEAEQTAIKQKYEAQHIHAANIAAMDQDGISAGITNYDKDYTYGNDSAYTYAGSQATGVVTVGSKDATRRIQNVSAGLVGPNSTDAVNGSQLYALTRQIRFGGDNSTFGKTTAADDVNVVAKGSNEKLAITGGAEGVSNTTTTDGKSVTTVDGTKIADKNIAVIAEDDALHVKLASNLKNLNTAQLGKTTATTTTTDDGTSTTTYSYQETLKLDGTGDNGGTLALKDAKGENGVMLRTSGATKTADVTGAETSRLLVNDKTVATTDDGLKFGGDTGTDSALKLNNKLTVKGGTTDTNKLTDNNIGVVSDGTGTLTVKLNKNVNLGTDGSLTTGTVTAATVTTGSSTLNTNGLTITGGPKFTSTGISANNQQIKNVEAGTDDTDAANYSQIKKATTTLTTGKNGNVNVTSDSTSADGHTNYTIAVDNLAVKANGTGNTTVALANGIDFRNGTNTTATVGTDGTVTIEATHNKLESTSYTASNPSDSSNKTTLKLKDTDGNETTLNLTDTYTTVSKNTDHTITFKRNDGSEPVSISLDDLNGASKEALKTATTTVVKGTNVDSVSDDTTSADGHHIYTVNVSNLGVKVADGQKTSVALSDGLVFGNGTNTTASVGQNGAITFNVSDAAIKMKAKDAIDVVKGNDNVTVDTTTSTDGTKKTFTISAKDTYTTVTKDADKKTVTFTRNDGTTPATTLSLSDFGAASTTDMTAAAAKATTEVRAGTNATLGTVETDQIDQHKIYTVNVDNLGLKQNGTAAGTVTLADGINFADGTNTSATVSDGKVTFDLKRDVTGIDTVTANNSIQAGNVKVGKQGTDNKNYVTGLDNKNWTVGQTTYEAGRAATEDQLKSVSDKVASGFQVTDGTTSANIGADKKVTFTNGNYTTAKVTQATDGASVQYDINTAQINAGANGTITAPITDGVATAANVAGAINSAAWNIKANDGTATAIKAGTTVGLKAGNNLTLSQSGTDFTYRLNDELTGIKRLTTDAQDGVTTTLAASGMTIASSGTGNKSVSLTANGLNNGGKQITDVASGGDTDTNAANISDVKRLVQASASGTTETGFNVKGDDATAKKVKLGKQLNVVGGTTDSSSLSNNNIGVVTTADDEGNATLTVKLNKDITLDSVKTGNTTLNTNGVSNGKMSLTGIGMTITDTDASKQVSVTTNGVSMGSQQVKNVADGTDAKDAVNKSQLDAVQEQVDNASWTIQDGNNTGNAQQVKAGDTVSLKAGDNLSLDQDGKKFTYKLNKTLENMTSVTAVDDKQNTAVLNGEGLKVSDKEGDSLTQHATEVRLHSATAATEDTSKDVVLNNAGLTVGNNVKFTNNGISAGDQKITGVADGEVQTGSKEAVNGGQLYELQQKVTNGWKITGNDTTKASNIGNDKTVSFVNGDNSYIKSKVDTTNTGATVSYTAQTASLTTTDGKAALTGTMDGLVTGTNLTSVLNNLSWTAQSSKVGSGQNSGSTSQSIAAGSKVSFIAGDNMILTQDGTNFTYVLNSSLTGMNTIAFTGLGNGASNLTIGLQNGGGANSDKGYYITGLSNTKWDQSNYEGTRAATEAQLREAIDKVSAATGTGGFGLTADEGANNGGEKKVSQTLGRTIAIQGDGTYDAEGKVVKPGNISTVAYTDNAGPTGAIKVKLNKDIDLSEAGSLTIGASNVSAGSIVLDNTSDAAKKIVLNSTTGTASIGGVTVNGAEKTVNGLSNTKWTGKAVDGQAATENQLVEAINEVKTQAANSELHIKKGVYAIGKDSQGQDVTDTKGKNSVSIDVVNATGTVDGQVVINDVAKASELGAVGELADNLKNPAGGPTTVVQAVNNVNQKVDDSLKQVNGDITNAVTEAKKHTEVKSVDSDNNVTIDGATTNAAGGTIYKLGLNKQHLNLGNVHVYGNEGRVTAKTVEAETIKIDDQTRLDKTGLTTGNTTVTNNRIIVGGDNGIKMEANGGQQTISGLSNRIWTGKAVSGRAATEDQLQQAVENATATAAQNEQHIQSGNYDVGQGKGLDGKPIGKNSVAINVVSGDGTNPGDVKGQVVINNVAKADELGNVAKLNGTVRNGNGHPTSTVDAINNLDNRVETKVGDNTYGRVKGKEIADGDSATTAIGKLNNRMNDIYTTAGQHSTVSTADANLTLSESKNASGGTDYQIGLNKDKINLGNVRLRGNDGAMEADTFTAGNTVVSNEGVKIGDKAALTSDTLKVNGKTYVSGDGLNANSQKITNVAAGSADTDAVNVKQVNDLAARQGEAITENAAHIGELGRAVNKLDNRINRVGAGAAALAALHPGSYDPDDKLDVSAGVGNYRGANAAAVGLFFHPNERTILSVAGSMGGGENMVNAGVTLKVGPGHGTPTTVTTRTGQKVDVMDILAKQTEILEKLAGNAKAVSAPAGSDIFPDVPQNHWAYAYVDKLYRTGSLAGFSEPGKLKSHMLTRKDFAEILYWAMTNGATTNPDLNSDGSLNRLAAEFGAELKLVMR